MVIAGKKTKAAILLAVIAVSLVMCTKPYHDNSGDEPMTREDTLSLRLIYALNKDTLISTVNWLQNMDTRFALAENRRDVAVAIMRRFKRLGYDNASLDSFQANINWNGQDYATWQYNVSAELTGSVHPDSVSIVGAHYDDIVDTGDPMTYAPGANDNASGVAAVLEIARVMKLTGYKPSISIRFAAFSANETGLLGSYDFAGKLYDSGRPVNIVINNDMIANESLSDWTLWSVNVSYYNNSEDLAHTVYNMSGRYIGLYPKNDSTNNKDIDSYPFYLKNYKAVSFSSSETDPNNHTQNDLRYYYNFTYCTLVTGISCALLVNTD